MAVGDAAAAAGLAVFPNTQLVSAGANNDNIRGDELAAEKTRAVAAETALSTGKFDANKIFVQATAPANIAGSGYSGRFWIKKA